ncbi:UPF0764 protein C16orf89 [Plecturocebus cupreus]
MPPQLANLFVFLIQMVFHHVGQAGLELLTSNDPPTSTFQSSELTSTMKAPLFPSWGRVWGNWTWLDPGPWPRNLVVAAWAVSVKQAQGPTPAALALLVGVFPCVLGALATAGYTALLTQFEQVEQVVHRAVAQPHPEASLRAAIITLLCSERLEELATVVHGSVWLKGLCSCLSVWAVHSSFPDPAACLGLLMCAALGQPGPLSASRRPSMYRLGHKEAEWPVERRPAGRSGQGWVASEASPGSEAVAPGHLLVPVRSDYAAGGCGEA